MDMTGLIIVGAAHCIWQAFGEDPNTKFSKASASQTNSILRKNIQHSAMEKNL